MNKEDYELQLKEHKEEQLNIITSRLLDSEYTKLKELGLKMLELDDYAKEYVKEYLSTNDIGVMILNAKMYSELQQLKNKGN